MVDRIDRQFIQFVKRHPSVLRFLFIGLVNTGVDLVLFTIFANLLSINPIIASILSTGITLCLSFLLNHYFVFRSTKRKRQTAALFVLVTLFNVWVIQSAIIWLVLTIFAPIEFFQTHQWTFNVFAKICGVGVSMVLNYLGYRTIFKERK